jgi:Family of unknown function (DUF6518)
VTTPSPRTSRPSLLTRALGGLGTSIAGGAALGAGAWLSDQLPWPYSLLIPANAVGAWLGVAFVLGASARTVPTGALRGLIGLLAAVAGYYALFAVFGQGFRAIGAGHAATVWGAVALVAGPVMGLAGSTWRHTRGGRRALGAAVLAAGLAGEGLVFGVPRLVHLDQLSTDPGALLYGFEILLGAVLPFVLLRPGERMRGYLATVALAIAAAVAIGPAISLLRDLADTF